VKLLVGDDDRDLVELLDYALRREGYEVVRAYDGEAALETLTREKPDLVVLDINLPKLAGFVVLERIRHVDEHVAVLLLSARQDESDILRGLQLGADFQEFLNCDWRPADCFLRLELAALDALGNDDFAFAREQRNHAHLAQIQTNRIVRLLQSAGGEIEFNVFVRLFFFINYTNCCGLLEQTCVGIRNGNV